MKPKVIALIGPQGCGKSTLVTECLAHGVGFTSESFANPMREMMAALLAMGDPEELKTIDKSEPIDYLNGHSIRHAMQTLGTEWGRKCMGDDIWTNMLLTNITNPSYYGEIFIDDARFCDEFTMLREETDLLLLRINRDDIPDQANDHESEHYWAKQEPDGVIDNNGTLEESIAQIERAIANKWGVE